MNQNMTPSADVVFRDPLGERRRMIDSTGHEAELLCLSPELTNVATFEPAVTRTVGRLADFRHPAFPRVRSVERFDPATVAVVSDAVHGVRLSRLLASLAERGIALEIGAALCITRELLAAIGALHAHDRDLSHGALGPERVILNSSARVVVADYVLGSGLEQLRYSHQHYWKGLRIGLPRSAGVTKFDHGVDILQVGSIALALLLGRLLKDDEYSAKLVDVINTTLAPGGAGEGFPQRSALRDWLLRSIQCDPHHSFASATEAGAVLDSLQSDEERASGLSSLERVLARHHGVAPAPVVVKSAVVSPIVETFVAPAPKPAVSVPPVSVPPVSVAPISVAAVVASESPVVAAAASEPPAPSPLRPIPIFAAAEPVAAVPPAKVAVAPTPVEPPAPPPMAVSVDLHPPAPARAVAAPPAAMPSAPRPAPVQEASGWQRFAAAVLALAVLTTAGIFLVRRHALASGLAPATGTLSVQSSPSGARLEIDGKSSGFTPATLVVLPGTHTIVLRAGGEPKTLSVAVAAGAQVSQYVELARAVATTGSLIVRTEPAGALVTVDRAPRGSSPASIADLSPGDHTVVVSLDGVSVEQQVNVVAGVSSSLVVPLAGRDRALLSGWVAVAAPIDIQILEGGRLLGTNQSDRVMVSSGEHHLDLVNDALGFRAARTLSVAPGKVENISLKLPTGSIAVNAVPWAEVWLDGEKVGDTPIGNLQAAIGRHEVVFRHPELGETRQSVTVTLLGPARLSVDMRKK